MDFIEELEESIHHNHKGQRCYSDRRGDEKRLRHALYQPFGIQRI